MTTALIIIALIGIVTTIAVMEDAADSYEDHEQFDDEDD